MRVVRSKKLRKLLTKKWPFNVKSIIITCIAGSSVYCEIDGKFYALNGFAQDKLDLIHIIDTNYMLVDKKLSINGDTVYMSISNIIEIGLNLFNENELNKLRGIRRGIKLINNIK